MSGLRCKLSPDRGVQAQRHSPVFSLAQVYADVVAGSTNLGHLGNCLAYMFYNLFKRKQTKANFCLNLLKFNELTQGYYI